MQKIRIVRNALIIPYSKGSGGLGVFDANKKFVSQSMILRQDAPLYDPPRFTEAEDYVKGVHLYAGIMSWHFGHFLVESLSRLWPLYDSPEPFSSLLFVPKGLADRDRSEAAFQAQVLDCIAPGMPRRVLTRPTRVERLIVPEQGFGTGNMEGGIAQFRSFIHSRIWPEPEVNAPKFLYVTRAGLHKRKKGHILGDSSLKQYLKKRGFYVVHPERLQVTEQISLYRGAKRLIFDDGSAVHLFGLVAQPGQVAASIQRRFADPSEVVGWRQLRTMAGIDLKSFDAVMREWRPAHAKQATSKSHGELDARHLFESLKGFGVVSEEDTAESLGLPSPHSVANSMAQIDYVPWERPKPLPEPPALTSFWGVNVPVGSHLSARNIRSLRDGVYKRQEVRNAFTHIQTDDRVLELGARAGILGSAIALNCKVEALLSFEDNSDLIQKARALYERNGLKDQVEIRHNIIVAGDNPSAGISVENNCLSYHTVDNEKPQSSSRRKEQVATVYLSEVVKEFQPTVLLMDIEGQELSFLENGDFSNFRIIIVKLHRRIYGRDGMKRCRAALRSAGLRQDRNNCRRGVETWIRD